MIHRRANKKVVHKHHLIKKEETSKSSTPQSLGKAKKRMKSYLPKSTRHKRELFMSLA